MSDRMLRRTILAREQRLAAQHLGQNAAHTPHINGLGVFLERQHDLRGTVPASSHIFRHEARVVVGRGGRASKTEIAHLQIAVGIEQEVGGLQITVQDVGRMHGLESSQCLVDKVLTVIVRQILRTDDTVHVGFHQFLKAKGQLVGPSDDLSGIPESSTPR